MSTMYAPAIVKAKEAERTKIGPYDARLLTDIEASGHVKYLYVLEVKKDGQPVLYISSEVNAMNAELGGGSHFLCAFEGEKHMNFGCSDKWADLETFKRKAYEMANRQLKVK
jgi:hypothetical protein